MYWPGYQIWSQRYRRTRVCSSNKIVDHELTCAVWRLDWPFWHSQNDWQCGRLWGVSESVRHFCSSDNEFLGGKKRCGVVKNERNDMGNETWLSGQNRASRLAWAVGFAKVGRVSRRGLGFVDDNARDAMRCNAMHRNARYGAIVTRRWMSAMIQDW